MHTIFYHFDFISVISLLLFVRHPIEVVQKTKSAMIIITSIIIIIIIITILTIIIK